VKAIDKISSDNLNRWSNQAARRIREKGEKNENERKLAKLGELYIDGQRNNIKRDSALNAYTLKPTFDITFASLQNSIDTLHSDRITPDILKERMR